ncbi:MAG: RNase H family protein [Acutalibacteraceae bacterium]|nr:RNase H family protein [Acutalibacteraceae bacterium]
MLKAWVDSSFDEKLKIAGIGVVLQDGYNQQVISNWIPCETNNYGELFAVFLATILTEGKAVIYTDSQCAIGYLNKWVKDKPRTEQQYFNHQRMRLLAYKIRMYNPEVQKIKAHTGQMKYLEVGNAMADLASKQGRTKYYLKLNNINRRNFEHIR